MTSASRLLRHQARTLQQLLARVVMWWWQTFRHQPGRALSFLLIMTLATALVAALILRVAKPYPALVVTPFETPTRGDGLLAVSGKTIASFLVDALQEILRESAKEVEVSSPGSKLRPVRFSPTFEATSVAIEVRGFSLGRILAEWDRIRQEQYQVSGDFVIGADGRSIRARLLPTGGWWEEHLETDSIAGLRRVAERLALDLLSHIRPDVAGLFYYRNAEFETADSLFQLWATAEPGTPEPYLYIGLARFAEGRGGEARDAYRQALAVDSNAAMVLVALAAELSEGPEKDEEFEEIIALYERAIEIKPDLAGQYRVNQDLSIAHYSLSVSMEQKGDTVSARRHFAEAQRLDPNRQTQH